MSETVLILKGNERDMNKNIYWPSCKVQYRYSCPVSMKREFSRQIFEKLANTKFHENPSGGSRVVPFGHTDGRTDIHDRS